MRNGIRIPGTDLAYKKAPDTKALWQDFRLTNLAYNAAFDTRGMLQEAFKDKTIPRIPQCHEFELPGSMDWWKANMERFPREHRTEGAVLLVDRILPLPQRARQALIKLYFEDSEEVQEEAMNDGENKHCLVRVYMGENETLEQQAGSYDSLRNFPLRLNMIEDLELEKAELAEEMAIGLAIIHWQAQVDAMDVEFVIGSAATTGGEESRADTRDTPPRQVRSINFKRRSTHLWILDFDKASEIQLTTEDVDKKLVPAFLGNDSYYPRPNIDEELWTSFCGTYLKASRLILESRMKTRSLELPQRFLDKVVETVKEFEDWDPEEQIVFGD